MPTINRPKKKTDYTDNQRKKRMKVYNNKLWVQTRKIMQMEQPLCQICEIEGRVKLSNDTHHFISPFNAKNEAQKDYLAYSKENVIRLCDECHNAIHHGKYKGCYSVEDIKERYDAIQRKQ